jgi:hypothetical protein
VPGFIDAALDVFVCSPVLADNTAEVYKLVDLFDVFLV